MSLSLLSTTTFDMWAERLVSASWQGGLLLAFVWLVCHFCKNVSANTKCWMWRIAYLKFAILLMFGGFLKLPVLQSNPQTSVSHSRPTSNPFIANDVNPFSVYEGSTGRDGMEEPTKVDTHLLAGSSTEEAAASASPAREFSRQTSSNPSVESAKPGRSGAIVLLQVWLVGFGIGVAFVGRQFLVANQLSRHGVPITEPSILTGYRVLCSRLKMSSRPRLAMTSRITTPILVGAICPTILIPSSMVRSLSSADLQLIIAHELGHAKRRDLFWNWLLVIVRTIFFFHPLVWITQKRFALDQEIACDQLALKTTNTNFQQYGRLLVKCSAPSSRRTTQNLAAVGAVSSFNSLRERILEMNRFDTQHSRFTGWLSMAALAACLALLAPIQLVAQQSESNEGQASASETSSERASSSMTESASSSTSSDESGTTNQERRNVSISVNDGEHSESIKVAWENQRVSVTYSTNANDAGKPQKHNLKDIAELEQVNPSAYQFYKKHTTENGNGVTSVSSGTAGGRGTVSGRRGTGAGDRGTVTSGRGTVTSGRGTVTSGRGTVTGGRGTSNRSRGDDYNDYGVDENPSSRGFNGARAGSSSSSRGSSSSSGRNGISRQSNNSGSTSTSSLYGNLDENIVKQIQRMMNQTDDPQMEASLQQLLNQIQNENQLQIQNQGNEQRQRNRR